MELKGILKQINPVVERGNFKSRKVWLTTEADSKYPQTIEVELQQDKVDLLASVAIGSDVNLHLNLRGNFWTNKETGKESVFNSLVCWKVDGVAYTKPAEAEATTAPMQRTEREPSPAIDDLPF